MSKFCLTRLSKDGGALTKRIALARDGTVTSDGSACVMSRGIAERMHIDGVEQLASLIGELRSDQAIALGALRSDLPDQVEITTKRALAAMNGMAQPGIIARIGGHITYATGRPVFALLDFDAKGIPPEVAAPVG